MKIFKLLGLTSTLALATIPFVLSTKHEVVRCDSDVKEIKENKFFVDGFSKTKLDMYPIPTDWGKDLVIKKLLSNSTTMSNNFTTYQNTGLVGFDQIQKQIDEIKKELDELKQQGKEHCKKFNDLKETLIKLQEQLKYNEKKNDEYSKKIDKLEDKISNSTITTCSTVGGGVVLATIPTLVKNKKKK